MVRLRRQLYCWRGPLTQTLEVPTSASNARHQPPLMRCENTSDRPVCLSSRSFRYCALDSDCTDHLVSTPSLREQPGFCLSVFSLPFYFHCGPNSHTHFFGSLPLTSHAVPRSHPRFSLAALTRRLRSLPLVARAKTWGKRPHPPLRFRIKPHGCIGTPSRYRHFRRGLRNHFFRSLPLVARAKTWGKRPHPPLRFRIKPHGCIGTPSRYRHFRRGLLRFLSEYVQLCLH